MQSENRSCAVKSTEVEVKQVHSKLNSKQVMQYMNESRCTWKKAVKFRLWEPQIMGTGTATLGQMRSTPVALRKNLV